MDEDEREKERLRKEVEKQRSNAGFGLFVGITLVGGILTKTFGDTTYVVVAALVGAFVGARYAKDI